MSHKSAMSYQRDELWFVASENQDQRMARHNRAVTRWLALSNGAKTTGQS
jgi:hypothetical protein